MNWFGPIHVHFENILKYFHNPIQKCVNMFQLGCIICLQLFNKVEAISNRFDLFVSIHSTANYIRFNKSLVAFSPHCTHVPSVYIDVVCSNISGCMCVTVWWTLWMTNGWCNVVYIDLYVLAVSVWCLTIVFTRCLYRQLGCVHSSIRMRIFGYVF